MTALEASVERGASLTGLTLTRAKAAPGPGKTELRLDTREAPSADEVRSIVQEELARSLTQAVPAATTAEEPMAPSDPIDNEEAFGQASRIVSGALSARVWGEREAAQLRELKSRLTPEHVRSLRAQLIPAINRQELRPDVIPPF
jgi:hypothetical protein